MNAQGRKSEFIPQFQSFERWGMQAYLLAKVLPKRLRDVIGHRDVMEESGQKIIRNLLHGMLELRKAKMVLRDINPINIALSENLA